MPNFRLAADAVDFFVYESIGEDSWDGTGVTAKQTVQAIVEAKKAGAKRFIVHINSPGGNAFEGITISNLLVKSGFRVEVEIEGLAASAASIVAMAGESIRIATNAMMMIHEASGMTVGTAEDHEQMASLLRKLNQTLADTYARRTGMENAAALELMAAETWMTGQEAVDMGFADAVVESKGKPEKADEAAWSPSNLRLLASYKRLPQELAASLPRREAAHQESRPAATTPPRQNKRGPLGSLAATLARGSLGKI